MRSRMSRKKERLLARLAARLPYEEAQAVYEELSYQKIMLVYLGILLRSQQFQM